MTDAHCHAPHGATRHFLCEPFGDAAAGAGDVIFRGIHPWQAAELDVATLDARLEALRAALAADPAVGVGEIGLDRLHAREIPPIMRTAFERQLDLAAAFARPVVLHGAKCWGQVVAAIVQKKRHLPAGARFVSFLFHGFSRSDGLLPDIIALNGYVSVGAAILNDHAVNYRALVRKLPRERLLVETDTSDEPLDAILAGLAAVRGESADALAPALDENAARFLTGTDLTT